MFPDDIWNIIISLLMPFPHNLAVCTNLYELIKIHVETYAFPTIMFNLPPFKMYITIYLQIGMKYAIKVTRFYYHKRKLFYLKLSTLKKKEFYLDKFTKVCIQKNIIRCEFFQTPNLYIVSKALPTTLKITST